MRELYNIPWGNSPNWSANIALGSRGALYKFNANWNTRGDSWSITITHDQGIVFQGIKLVLNVDLLKHCHDEFAPDGILYAATENKNIDRISFDNMINSDVKLYHVITPPFNNKGVWENENEIKKVLL
jgi:hypothetical protein